MFYLEEEKTGGDLVAALFNSNSTLLTTPNLKTWLPQDGQGQIRPRTRQRLLQLQHLNSPFLEIDYPPVITEINTTHDTRKSEEHHDGKSRKKTFRHTRKRSKCTKMAGEDMADTATRIDHITSQTYETAAECFKKWNGKPPRKPLNLWWNTE